MGTSRKTRYEAQLDGERKRRKKKDERRARTKKRRPKTNGKMRKPTEKQNKQSF